MAKDINKSFERDLQERFLELIKNQKENKTSNAFGIYQKLVFYRYEEIVKSTFIQYCKLVSQDKIDETILDFVKTPPKTTFVWQIAKDYMKFIKKNKYFKNKKYINEILYFDWVELELIMKEYKQQEKQSFSWKKTYVLNENTKLKKFKYDIILGEYENKRDNFVLIYYDFNENDVFYREINEVVFLVLKSLNVSKSIAKILKSLCKKYELNFKEAKEVLETSFVELTNLNIIKEV
jgi:hypothetical protein